METKILNKLSENNINLMDKIMIQTPKYKSFFSNNNRYHAHKKIRTLISLVSV